MGLSDTNSLIFGYTTVVNATMDHRCAQPPTIECYDSPLYLRLTGFGFFCNLYGENWQIYCGTMPHQCNF